MAEFASKNERTNANRDPPIRKEERETGMGETAASANEVEEEPEQVLTGETTTSRCANYRLSCAHEEMNPRRRCTMEDCYRVVPALGEDPTISYFGVYDGHGGRQIVEFLEPTLGT